MQQLHFDTADLPPEQRFLAFAASAPEFDIAALGDPSDFWTRCTVTAFGPLVLTESAISGVLYRRTTERILEDGKDFLSIALVREGDGAGTVDGCEVRYRAGDAVILDLARPSETRWPPPTAVIIVLMPRYFLEEALPGTTIDGVIPDSPALALATSFICDLLRRAPLLDEASGVLHARAVRDLLAAAMAPLHQDEASEGRRAALLLDRLTRHIDARIAEPITVEELGAALNVSRSSLYRATRQVGGAAGLIRRRRLIAVYRCLNDRADRRPIAEIARSCGFTDISQFSRQLRRAFGATATEIRQRRTDRPSDVTASGSIQDNYKILVNARLVEPPQ